MYFKKYLAPIKEKFNEIDAIEDLVEKQKAVNDFVGNVRNSRFI